MVQGGPERSWSTKGGHGPRGPPGPLRSALIHTLGNFTFRYASSSYWSTIVTQSLLEPASYTQSLTHDIRCFSSCYSPIDPPNTQFYPTTHLVSLVFLIVSCKFFFTANIYCYIILEIVNLLRDWDRMKRKNNFLSYTAFWYIACPLAHLAIHLINHLIIGSSWSEYSGVGPLLYAWLWSGLLLVDTK